MSYATWLERTRRQNSQPDSRLANPTDRSGDLRLQGWFTQVGWEGAVSRLKASRIEPSHSFDQCDGLTVACMGTSQTLEFAGRSPSARVSLVVPRADHDLWINGRNLRRGDVVSLPPGVETIALFRSSSRALIVSIPAEPHDHEAGVARAPSGGAALADFLTSGCPDRAKARHVRALIDDLAARPVAADEEAADIAFRIILKARTYIETHLARRIRMTDVCEHAATSLSRLERTFRRELDLSPSQYLLAIRLEAVRRALKSASERETSVAHVAHDCGFNHLGRFAAAYRRHFGELPSHTLRAGPGLQP